MLKNTLESAITCHLEYRLDSAGCRRPVCAVTTAQLSLKRNAKLLPESTSYARINRLIVISMCELESIAFYHLELKLPITLHRLRWRGFVNLPTHTHAKKKPQKNKKKTNQAGHMTSQRNSRWSRLTGDFTVS